MVEEMSESGICDDWQPWTQWTVIQWAFYVAFAVSCSVFHSFEATFFGDDP